MNLQESTWNSNTCVDDSSPRKRLIKIAGKDVEVRYEQYTGDCKWWPRNKSPEEHNWNKGIGHNKQKKRETAKVKESKQNWLSRKCSENESETNAANRSPQEMRNSESKRSSERFKLNSKLAAIEAKLAQKLVDESIKCDNRFTLLPLSDDEDFAVNSKKKKNKFRRKKQTTTGNRNALVSEIRHSCDDLQLQTTTDIVSTSEASAVDSNIVHDESNDDNDDDSDNNEIQTNVTVKDDTYSHLDKCVHKKRSFFHILRKMVFALILMLVFAVANIKIALYLYCPCANTFNSQSLAMLKKTFNFQHL